MGFRCDQEDRDLSLQLTSNNSERRTDRDVHFLSAGISRRNIILKTNQNTKANGMHETILKELLREDPCVSEESWSLRIYSLLRIRDFFNST